MTEWLEKESLHYIVHYKKDSFAHKNIFQIMEEQEQRIYEIFCYFPVILPRKIEYWLCDTREEIAKLADYEPTNGLFCWDDDEPEKVSIYAVYNETMHCTGYHEETHAVVHFLNEPTSSAMAEGVAVFMDKTWWGVDIHLCTYLYYRAGKYVSVEKLICNKQENGDEFFLSIDCAISYPCMGAFVAFLFSKVENGVNTFVSLYQYQEDNWKKEIERIYECSFSELEVEFLNYINSKEYTEMEIELAKERLNLKSCL